MSETRSSNDAQTSTAPEVDVLIVGAGPAGLTSALELARLGIRSIVVTRYPYTAHTPRAHVINQRTMEIFRHLGIEDRVAAESDTAACMENNPWVTSLAGVEVARITAWGAGEADRGRYDRASPSAMCNLSQHLLEPILLEAVVASGLVDLRFGHEFLSFEQDDTGVSARIRVRESGGEYAIRSTYLIGADGARSRVLDQAGLRVEGPPPLGEAAFVWIRADLTRLVAHRPGILYHCVIPDGRAGFIMVRPWDEWIAGLQCGPDFDPTDHDAILQRVRNGIGDPTIDIEIRNVSRWSINSLSAPHYSAGRVFCMGDAVHRHSPWNGLGLNTSVADAHNLAWKLALVLDGIADPALLETFSTERAPIGRQIVHRATLTAVGMMQVPGLLGMRPGMPPDEAWDQIELLQGDSPEGAALREKLDAHVQMLKGPGFNALGVEVGYRYRDGALVSDGSDEPVADDPETDYVATTWPGARLPHVWLEAARSCISTLDLVGHGRFTLIVGRDAGPWHQAVRDAKRSTRAPIQLVQIGAAHGLQDPLGDWAKVREVGEDGAVLVRPDAHVAWRAEDASRAGDFELVMRSLLRQSTWTASPLVKNQDL